MDRQNQSRTRHDPKRHVQSSDRLPRKVQLFSDIFQSIASNWKPKVLSITLCLLVVIFELNFNIVPFKGVFISNFLSTNKCYVSTPFGSHDFRNFRANMLDKQAAVKSADFITALNMQPESIWPDWRPRDQDCSATKIHHSQIIRIMASVKQSKKKP